MNLILKKSWMDGISRTSNATTTPPLWFKVLSIPSPPDHNHRGYAYHINPLPLQSENFTT